MNKFVTTTDTIYNNSVKDDIIIAHISDIHFSNTISEKMLNSLKKYLIAMEPNYIMITGDVIDYPSITKNKTKIKELITFLTDLGKYTKVLISLGNHDVMAQDSYLFFDSLNEIYNVYILNNTSYKDENIYVSGLTLSNDYYYNITKEESVDILLDNLNNNIKLIENLPRNLPKISLIHSPISLTNEKVIDKLHEYDLILCGHTHNGLVPRWLYFLFRNNIGLVGPNNHLFPKVAKGKMEEVVDGKKLPIIINGAITKFSERSGPFKYLNFLYNRSVNKIIVRKEEKNEN